MKLPGSNRFGFHFTSAVLVGIAAITANAEESTSGFAIQTVAESRVQAGGTIEYVPAEQLHVGDEIFYTLRVRNTGGNAQEAVVVKAIPRNTRYVQNSATGPAAIVEFSVDGGKSFAGAEQLTIRTTGSVVRNATEDDYTHIRWRLRHSLAAGATALLRFRAVFK
jgi:uncharacterized repeat protein (TIGR01451 family)